MKKSLGLLVFVTSLVHAFAQSGQAILLTPERVFDGETVHQGWAVLVHGEIITGVGPLKDLKVPNDAEAINMPGMTLMPGLIEGHSHVLLHPYDETSWNDQVLKESEAERVARATVHVRNTLLAGFTTIRDLGSEGANFADVGIKTAIEKGVIPGPRMLVATKAIVATGSYGPKGFAPHFKVPLGAEIADGYDDLVKVVRDQIGHGADFIKVYADYRWGPNGEAMPTFSKDELELIVQTAKSSGRPVVAHASTAEGMRRATLAGVETIEHGDGGTKEVFLLMKERGVAFCPTIAAGDAIMQYVGWKKGTEPEPARIAGKRRSFKLALEAGVKICAGSDVGVFTHGDNVRELELMADYGMDPMDVLIAATSQNAKIFHMERLIGRVSTGMLADLIAVDGDPTKNLSILRSAKFVMKGGEIYKRPN